MQIVCKVAVSIGTQIVHGQIHLFNLFLKSCYSLLKIALDYIKYPKEYLLFHQKIYSNAQFI